MLFLKLPLTFVDLTVVFPLVCNVTVQMDSLQLGDHVVQNRQTGEQMTHWDKKPPNLNFLCFTCPSVSFALQFGDFVPRDRSAAKGPFNSSFVCSRKICVSS